MKNTIILIIFMCVLFPITVWSDKVSDECNKSRGCVQAHYQSHRDTKRIERMVWVDEQICAEKWEKYFEHEKEALKHNMPKRDPKLEGCPRPESSCAEEWKKYDGWIRKSSDYDSCDGLERGQPRWDCLNQIDRDKIPDYFRPEKPKPECRWEWKRQYESIDATKRTDWGEPFAVTSYTKNSWYVWLKRRVCEEESK
ncbi:hypothetical protein LCGC14_2266250 [marine sediment metagenome]|uniref:Uncharacterized protein n=1 Tax=marine sediment metagenome TaxID=412755 RepID=A0A0F9CYE2_9ZZZZ